MTPHEPAPPASQTPPDAPDPGFPRLSRAAVAAAVIALTPFGLTGAAVAARLSAPVDVAVGALAFVVSLVALAVAIGAALRLGAVPADDRPPGRLLAVLAIPASALGLVWGFLFAAATMMSFARGRQLRERGRPLFAPLVRGKRFIDDVAAVDAPPAAAAAWRESGKTEHASVVAFARLVEELTALGAPASLVEDARRDGADEVRHTRLCFSLAYAMDGAPLEPGTFPAPPAPLLTSRAARLARLAVESLVDGALNEGVSARVVAALARRVEEPAVARVLVAIAADEGRHARHAWDVLAWCLAEGGAPARAATRGALAALPRAAGAVPAGAVLTGAVLTGAVLTGDGALERWGIPSQASLDAAHRAVRAAVVTRSRRLLGLGEPRARAAQRA